MSTPVISVKGKEFYCESTKTRFVVRGVALSSSGVKALNNIDDILQNDFSPLFKELILPNLIDLKVNCIRVYQVNPGYNHKQTLDALKKAGIYVMVGLANSTDSVKQMTGEYSYGTFLNAAKIVDEFQAYDNTLCFSVGNEVEFPGEQASNLHAQYPGDSDAEIVEKTKTLELKVAQAMKSFARDVKNHITTKNYRTIPVGAAMQDGPQSAWENSNPNKYQVGIIGTDTIAQYYAAGNEAERMDYIGINSYRYIPGGSMSSYDGLATEASFLPVPVFLTESGALNASPPTETRTWKIVPQMYTRSELYPQLSGQVAFEMLEEGNYYGLYLVDCQMIRGVLKCVLLPTTYGGAKDLAKEYGKMEPQHKAAQTPTPPTTAPSKAGKNPVVNISWPANLLPVKQAPNANITVENYYTGKIQITQNDQVMGVVEPGSNTNPTSGHITVISGTALTIQGDVSGSWDEVCGVKASKVKAGITVKTNVTWGSPCNVS